MYFCDEFLSRGSQEITVCKIKHIKTRAPIAKHAIMNNDICTLQNKNWKIALRLMKLVISDGISIKIIDQKFV